uniref:Myotubularin phosphatase domain-containing protein n=1 Tax=Meloidogyne hapla TaxID=6305 RepID=A0A1I8BTG2_MELHA
MEAELFQEITDALRDKSNHILLPVENVCPIQKIVWSSFDYMAGPEMRFCWEADYSIRDGDHQTVNNSEGIELDNEIETGDGCVSTSDSSYTKNTSSNSAQFEDIDAYNSESFQLASLKFGRNNDSVHDFDNEFEISIAHSSTMVESTDSFSHIQSTSEQLTPQKEKLKTLSKSSTFELIKNQERNETVANENNSNEHQPSSPAMVTSCVDSGIAPTISTESNLSAILLQEPKENVIYKANNQSCDIHLQKGELLSQAKINGAHEVIEFDGDNYSETSVVEDIHPVHTEIQNSFITSQIGSSFFSSTYSNPVNTSSSSNIRDKNSKINEFFQKEAEFLNAEMTPNESNGHWMAIPDEAFVAKHVLAEQIASVQLSSNPVLHKFCIVAARHISFGSYIFATRTENQKYCASPNLAAFTVILPIEKPAHTVESLDDLVCRCTREFSTFLTTISALERWPLSLQSNISQLRIQQSHLWELNLERINTKKNFIARCITASLICRGRCAIVGSNSKEVMKLLMTLCAFTKPQDRFFSLRPYRLPYCPYIRLQAIRRTEIYQFFEQAANAHWPCSLIDIDRGSVIYTGLYQKHRIQKRAEQHFQIFYVFREAMDCGLDIPNIVLNDLNQKFLNGGGEFIKNILETQIVKAEQSIIEFLEQICLMPLNRSARISFIDHFHLRLENRAKSLITYIRDISKPLPDDKWGALSGRWSCKTVRRNLNLLHDSTFGIVLAEAERLQPEIAEFIVQHTKIAEHPMNKN